ncbi:MAG TPA: SsrA-binding protein SmpB [Verrucomicrobiae bacterium]|nr:SsrA-binding protein SmpB [Verrucomicrobiae bacterium]
MGTKISGAIATNRHARRDFHILETVEAGIVLSGTEVKSIRAGRVNLANAFARVEGGEIFLYQCHIAPYEAGGVFNHEAERPRKLLMHRAQIDSLRTEVEAKGRAIVALEMHWKEGRVKIVVGLASGKTHEDRRDDIKRAAANREIDRAIKNRLRR